MTEESLRILQTQFDTLFQNHLQNPMMYYLGEGDPGVVELCKRSLQILEQFKIKDFYKQTVKVPVIFKRSKLPPIGLDQFFKLLELAENDEVASIAINIILLFTTSYESFEYDDPIEIINTIILPKIKSLNLNDSNLIKRYLKVLFEISRQTEISLEWSDF